MPEKSEVFQHYADTYERLVAREDFQGNIRPALQSIRPLDGLEVVEFGAGTGRFTLMLAPLVRRILAFDASLQMLRVAQSKLRETTFSNWSLAVGDNTRLPVSDDVADMAIAGWSFGHATVWHAEDWRPEIEQALSEMKRVLTPGGTAIIFETLGTGSEKPHPPTERLAGYYKLLEDEHNFSSTWIRTDYKFASVGEAAELLRFFFGDEMGDKALQEGWATVPECTGIWWLTI